MKSFISSVKILKNQPDYFKYFSGRNTINLCYCRKWFYNNYHNNKFILLFGDEVEKFKPMEGNDFDVLLTKKL